VVIKQSFGERTFEVFNISFMAVLCLVTLYPFVHILFASLSDPVTVVQNRGLFLYPKGFTIEAYKRVFDNPIIWTAYMNTIILVIIGTSTNIFLTALGAYGLSRKKVMWANTIMFMIVITMFFDGGLIPLYLTVNNLGLMDTRWALILPTAISAFNLIIMRTAFQGIPDEFEESARLDGAKDFTILFRIILPLTLPVVAVMVLFYGVHHWNAWFHSMIFIQNRELYPLQLVLREILISNDTSDMSQNVGSGDQLPIGETIKYSTIIVATIPILCLYPFIQKYFAKGVMIGAIKG
jgi:putative aldouronate transport system permease protein